ncbi:MAG: hypothetical protein AAF570_18220, partial [Bacteroidota bacterium]
MKKTEDMPQPRFEEADFNAENLSLKALYVTSADSRIGEGYKEARIFSNKKMRTRLIVAYSYTYQSTAEDRAETAWGNIREVTEKYLKKGLDPQNPIPGLVISQMGTNYANIKSEWTWAENDGGYLVTLDESSKYTAPDVMAMGGNSGGTYDGRIFDFEMELYLIPPYHLSGEFKLFAYLRENDQSKTGYVTLKVERFAPVPADFRFIGIKSATSGDGEGSQMENGSLFALTYHPDKYGAVRLNGISHWYGTKFGDNSHNFNLTALLNFGNGACVTTLAGIYNYETENNGSVSFLNTDTEYGPGENPVQIKLQSYEYEFS